MLLLLLLLLPPAPEQSCLDEVDALLGHQPRDDSNHGLVCALIQTQTLQQQQQQE
jgi:hypothetical protein